MSRRVRGFTLIELMVVLGVVSVLAVMIVPRFEGTYRRSLLRATARELAAAVDLASSRAATTVRLHRLRVDPASGEWAIEERMPGGRFELVSSVPRTSGRLEAGIRVRVESGVGAPLLLAGGPGDAPGGSTGSSAAPAAPAPVERPQTAGTREPAGRGASSPGGSAGRAAPHDARAPGNDGFEPAVSFRPDGTSEGGELIFEVEDGARMALRIHPSTGRVRIIDLGREVGPGSEPPRSPMP
jgi:prepilin-type N-terminal cleavage/methylation domain-containing protein